MMKTKVHREIAINHYSSYEEGLTLLSRYKGILKVDRGSDHNTVLHVYPQ